MEKDILDVFRNKFRAQGSTSMLFEIAEKEDCYVLVNCVYRDRPPDSIKHKVFSLKYALNNPEKFERKKVLIDTSCLIGLLNYIKKNKIYLFNSFSYGYSINVHI